MKCRVRTALRAASGLATVVASLQSSHAAAAPDPFALPGVQPRHGDGSSDADAAEEFLHTDPADETFHAAIRFNGRRLDRLAPLRWIRGELAIEASFAFAQGIITVLPPRKYVHLAAIPGAQFDFHEASFTLDLRAPLKSTGPNDVSFAHRPERSVQASSDLVALIVDYDLSLQADRRGVTASGLVAPRLVRGNVALESSWRFATRGDRVSDGVTRLDTALTIRDPERVGSATIGDFITQTPAGSRAVRMGGLRIGTDFSTRPDLVTYPLPDFVDEVAVPTGLDVLVNGRRIAETEILPGEFTLRDIPIPVGRGEVGVVTRDALGREVLRTVPFYGSRDLLAPELFEGALNLGVIRRRYGSKSHDYGPFAVSTMLRTGFSPRFTGTLMLEGSGSVANLGLAGDALIGDLGILSVTARGSRSDLFGGRRESGHMLEVGFQSVGPQLTYSIEYRDVSRHYADIASAAGGAQPPSLLAANISFDLREHGRLRLSAVRQQVRDAFEFGGSRRPVRLLNAGYRRKLHRRIDLTVDASYRRDGFGDGSFAVLAGISMPLGGTRFAQASYSTGRGQDYWQAGYHDHETGPDDTGFVVTAGAGAVERLSMRLGHQRQWARMDAEAEIVGDEAAARLGMRGAIILVDGEIFASRGMGDTYLLVDAGGISGLEIQRENRPAGTTDDKGRLLLDEVPGYDTIKVGVDPDRLPVEVVAASLEEHVAAAPRSVARVRLDVTRHLPETLRLFDPQGQAFAPGTLVTALPSETRYLVGFDGLVEINGALDDVALEVEEAGGATCRAELALLVHANDNDLPELRCDMRSRSYFVTGPQDVGRPDRARAVPPARSRIPSPLPRRLAPDEPADRPRPPAARFGPDCLEGY